MQLYHWTISHYSWSCGSQFWVHHQFNQSSTPCDWKYPTLTILHVGIPNDAIIQALHDATLNIYHLPVYFSANTKAASVLTTLAKNSLFLLVNYVIMDVTIFYLIKEYVSVIIDGVTTIISTIDNSNRPFQIDLTPNSTPLTASHPSYVHITNSAYAQETKTELLDFLYQAAFSPTFPFWTKAINNKLLATWPGLTADAVRKFLPDSINTAKGHMKKVPKHLQSTKPSRLYNVHPLLWRRWHLPLWILPSKTASCI